MSDHIPDDDPNAPYTERMCRAVDRSFMAAFREGQKLERELMEARAEVRKLEVQLDHYHTANDMAEEAFRERDEARAEVARLREALQLVMDWSPKPDYAAGDKDRYQFTADMDAARKVLEETK